MAYISKSTIPYQVTANTAEDITALTDLEVQTRQHSQGVWQERTTALTCSDSSEMEVQQTEEIREVSVQSWQEVPVQEFPGRHDDTVSTLTELQDGVLNMQTELVTLKASFQTFQSETIKNLQQMNDMLKEMKVEQTKRKDEDRRYRRHQEEEQSRLRHDNRQREEHRRAEEQMRHERTERRERGKRTEGKRQHQQESQEGEKKKSRAEENRRHDDEKENHQEPVEPSRCKFTSERFEKPQVGQTEFYASTEFDEMFERACNAEDDITPPIKPVVFRKPAHGLPRSFKNFRF